MSFLERLTGGSPEQQEHKGDRLMAAGQWGEAKLAYENALAKIEKRAGNPNGRQQLAAKIQRARQALARDHWQLARDLMDGRYWEEAREMLTLAIDVSTDQDFKCTLEQERQALEARCLQAGENDSTMPAETHLESPEGETPPTEDDEDFLALCHTLPPAVRKAYQGYGEDFKRGYMALNRGAFANAARLLEQAHQTHSQPDSYIPLELATAYLNLNRPSEAHDLLVVFRRHHPEALPAYQLLCEIYWDRNDFAQALALLDTLPSELSASVATVRLRGETLTRAGEHEGARRLYRRFLETHGWNTTVAHLLARVYRYLQDNDRARDLYQEIMNRGHGCGARIDPWIRHEYAELCFEKGRYDADLLEIYLTLVREIPVNAAHYYQRAAHIYARQGHDHEARRFRDFARRVAAGPIARDEPKGRQ